MRAVVLQRKVFADQTFDLDRELAAPDVGIVAAVELLDYGKVFKSLHTVIGKELKIQ